MNLSSYIPAGRTSLVKKGELNLQIQTEYACRPYPRLTTTVINNGQVLHKIEKKLDKPIESFEEQAQLESVIKKQHLEVVKIIQDNNFKIGTSNQNRTSGENKEFQNVINDTTTNVATGNITDTHQTVSFSEQFKAVPGVHHIYKLDNEGNFTNKVSGEQFKKSYGAIFKNLSELFNIFSIIPGLTITRKKGVYEVDRNKLYMVSAGDEFYFITIVNYHHDIDYEKVFKEILDAEC